MPSLVDLHTHTTASDGTMSPIELFSKACDLGVRVLAISDHDSTAGLESLKEEAEKHAEIRLIPAIEMSAEGELYCHLLAYFIDPRSDSLQKKLAHYRQLRLERIKAMTKKINDLGMPVEYTQVVARANGGSVGRPHLADTLVERGYVRTRKEAFERYLKRGGPAYIPGEAPAAQECLDVIRSAGGIPVLAHPSYYMGDEMLKRLVDMGLMGLEVYYPEHSKSLIQRYLELAKTYGLVATGGSDFHGPKTQRSALACVNVPESVVEELERVHTSKKG